MSSNPLHDDHDQHDDFGGLGRDLVQLVGRRKALQWMGGVSLVGILAACGSSTGDTPAAAGGFTPATTGPTSVQAGAAATTVPIATAAPTAVQAGVADTAETTPTVAPTASQASPGEEIPDETGGPYPADGSNGPNVLIEADIVRSDITTSFGSNRGTADGVPMNIQLTVVDAASGDPLAGAAVYLWSCAADGRYSVYQVTDQNYLRGIQVADDSGRVTFASIFPGCYAGRWPHCHFEIYDSLDLATAGSLARKTSQLTLPQVDCETVYADERYSESIRTLGQLSLASDHVFRDGWEYQLATIVGTGTENLTASLLVRV